MKLHIDTNNLDLTGLSEQDAIKLFSLLYSKFHWKGAIFTNDDIEYAVKNHNDNVEYHEKVTVEDVRHTMTWQSEMTKHLISEALVVLDSAIYEAMNSKDRMAKVLHIDTQVLDNVLSKW